MEYVVLILGILLVVGALWTLIWKRPKDTEAERGALQAKAEHLEQELINLRAQYQQREIKMEQQAKEAQQQWREWSDKQLADQKQLYENMLEEKRQEYRQAINELHQQQQTLHQQMQEQQEQQLQQQEKLIGERFKTMSEQILTDRSRQLADHNTSQLATILQPLNEGLKQMREAVEKSDQQRSMTMERLGASIEANFRMAKEVGERADKLANALTSENKTQGNFGELRLRTLLENMGLEEGTQYEEQVTLRSNGQTVTSEEGHRLQPDVILHFPDHRDVIIDSKMSLKAFYDYHNATSDDERQAALERHVESVRRHVKELARKKYHDYTDSGRRKLDFVMMYVFSEGALQLALSQAPSLWSEAYDQGVVITGSQTLSMMLRILEMTWRQVRQAENQDNIMQAANELVNRVQMFYERLQDTRGLLQRTVQSFDQLEASTAESGRGIPTAARKLLKYGAKENPKRKMRLPEEAAEEKRLENVTSDESEEAEN